MWSLNNTVLPELKELSNVGQWAVCANRPVTLLESLWKKKNQPTHWQASRQSPGRQKPSPGVLAGSPGPPAWPQLYWGLRPWWAGPCSKCPLPTREGPDRDLFTCGANTSKWSWERCPMGSGVRVGGEGGPGPPRPPPGRLPWAHPASSPVFTQAHRVRVATWLWGLLSLAAHVARPGPDWGWRAPLSGDAALGPSRGRGAPSGAEPLYEPLCIWKTSLPGPPAPSSVYLTSLASMLTN